MKMIRTITIRQEWPVTDLQEEYECDTLQEACEKEKGWTEDDIPYLMRGIVEEGDQAKITVVVEGEE